MGKPSLADPAWEWESQGGPQATRARRVGFLLFRLGFWITATSHCSTHLLTTQPDAPTSASPQCACCCSYIVLGVTYPAACMGAAHRFMFGRAPLCYQALAVHHAMTSRCSLVEVAGLHECDVRVDHVLHQPGEVHLAGAMDAPRCETTAREWQWCETTSLKMTSTRQNDTSKHKAERTSTRVTPASTRVVVGRKDDDVISTRQNGTSQPARA